MITLTKLNGETFLLNVLLVERIEFLPDTTITLTNGKKYVVKDSKNEVVEKIIRFYKEIGLTSSVNMMEGNEEIE
ncbi:flagellar FlbD family protein [Bacillus sp. FJAT-47783]|uniref:flagellar FlbD family protein n=1 Tax=Bacillus sp. FJAT-47783 TaxID=2922712 RepID=UPI001FAE61D5|nr:flagellar FlbD family protein [Bacillus sp. FJAT-47783]